MDLNLLRPSDSFVERHIGPSDQDVREMLGALGLPSLDALIEETIPAAIRLQAPLDLGVPPRPRTEHALLDALRTIARKNRVLRSFIGMGYHDTITPPVVQRNVLENPGWYTQYTPYQAEISQGRLEAMLNFQTMVADLTGLPLANSSLLDEATAAAEAMTLARRVAKEARSGFFATDDNHPQTLALLATRAEPLGIKLIVGKIDEIDVAAQDLFGVLLAYPTTDGRVWDPSQVAARVRDAGAVVCMATDLLGLTILKPPGELGADIAVGSAQRFGVPLGFGGPHAAFLATHDVHSRHMPGRIVGVSRDAAGNRALRLALQTREQHIRRDRATSNICTAQVLLAVMASMYAVYHGPEGLRRIATRVHGWAALVARGLARLGHETGEGAFFDTLRVRLGHGAAADVHAAAEKAGMNLRRYADDTVGIALDEATTQADVQALLDVFAGGKPRVAVESLAAETELALPPGLRRTTAFLEHPVWTSHHSEHEMLRYLHRLQARDLSLTTSMIPLGSCTMKLNATVEMIPVTWPEFGRVHPFAPPEQAQGYAELCGELEGWLARITGFAATSLQPNAGAQGEYAGLLVIRAYQEARGEGHRDVCLIPTSAHGTNPASAVLAGYRVVTVACDDRGNIDVADVRKKAEAHASSLAAFMVTYPSTHGVFESSIREICEIIHAAGGQVYMDGANMNAQVGLCRPADIGADVCHLNLHKTFCIPHGGGGPGMGPICVAAHLAPHLSGHPFWQGLGDPRQPSKATGAVSAAPYGSASILPIPWVYIALMGGPGLKRATEVAILNANYMAKRLEKEFEVLYAGERGRVAHEFILDLRPFKKSAGVEVEDVAKRLMDYGFHAPTMSFPVPGTLMIEPTESEPKAELDRFVDSMLSIREEIRAIEEGRMDRVQNPLKRAPHTMADVTSDSWDRPYTREQAAFPLAHLRQHKFWPPVQRIDNAYGDRNLVCACPPIEAFT